MPRKWQDLAAPDDPNSWLDVNGAWPTGRGTYETADVYAASGNITMTGETGGSAAFAFTTLSATRSYFLGDNSVWEITGGSATDRTGGIVMPVTYLCQYGDVTLGSRSTGASLVYSTGGNFAALAGSPSAKIVVVQSNAVVAFNTSVSADGWAASDTGDYTNWSTGEAASGRILEGKGPITAAVAFGDDIIVFKRDSIFRMKYVGGIVKWQIHKVYEGIGCWTCPSFDFGGNAAVATKNGVFFLGPTTDPLSTTARYKYYLFDGTSAPVCVNPLTTVRAGIPVYDSLENVVTVYAYAFEAGSANTSVYAFNLEDAAWGYIGKIAGSSGTGTAYKPIRGDRADIGTGFGDYSPLRPLIRSGNFRAVDAAASNASNQLSATFKSHYYGRPDKKTLFTRCTPILRRRVNRSGGSASAVLNASFYLERHDTATSATASPTEDATRDRFDFTKAECFGQFQVSFTDIDMEIDDLLLAQQDAGAN